MVERTEASVTPEYLIQEAHLHARKLGAAPLSAAKLVEILPVNQETQF